MEALKEKAPGTKFAFADGSDLAAAAKAAAGADVAVVFAWQWEAEDADLPSLSLPGNQDALIAAVAAANPRTVVVLETGTAVTMPWLKQTAAVMEAWYPGSRGELAIADVLFGDVNPSGKLPMTFPVSEADLPRPTVALPPKDGGSGLTFSVDYTEGAAVGYKWYESQKKPVLFPFGFGLSYSSFHYAGLQVAGDRSSVSFTLTNTGKVKGAEVAQVYARLPESAGEPWERLVGWQRVVLEPGESREVTVKLEPLAMSVWDVTGKRWTRPAGDYRVMVGASSADDTLSATLVVR